ncbi:MAG: hypothetical protein QOD39_156 [Mycobacterium sp.]|nr:hypothetical protein [Mycobacterium sp.]
MAVGVAAGAGFVGSALHRQANEPAGSSASTAPGVAARAAVPAVRGAAGGASPDRGVVCRDRANQAARGVAAAVSPARFCLIGGPIGGMPNPNAN